MAARHALVVWAASLSPIWAWFEANDVLEPLSPRRGKRRAGRYHPPFMVIISKERGLVERLVVLILSCLQLSHNVLARIGDAVHDGDAQQARCFVVVDPRGAATPLEVWYFSTACQYGAEKAGSVLADLSVGSAPYPIANSIFLEPASANR